jgi:hypothetical protein
VAASPRRVRASAQSAAHSASQNHAKILGEFASGQLGQVAAEGPAAFGTRAQPHVAIGELSFVLGPLTVGVGERLPGTHPTFELVEGLLDCVLEQRRCVTFQHARGDARVGGDARHQLRLGDPDAAIGLSLGPRRQSCVESGGLDSAVGFGTGEPADVFDRGPGREEPLPPERIRPFDGTSSGHRGRLDGSACSFDALQPCPHLHCVESGRIYVVQGSDRRGGPLDHVDAGRTLVDDGSES